MFDIGWSEMAIIMLVALVVIGPKDLPRLARTLGQWVAKGRAMAREFQRSLEDMAREAELDDVKREIEKVGRTNIRKSIEKTIDPTGDLGRAFDPNSNDKAPAKASGGPSANGEAKEPAIAKPEAITDSKPTTKPATAESKPTAGPGASTEGASAPLEKTATVAASSKPRSTAKANTAAKPKSPKSSAKPKAASAKPKAAGASASKPATSDSPEAETVAEPG